MKDFLFVLTGSVALDKAIGVLRACLENGFTLSVICSDMALRLIGKDNLLKLKKEFQLVDNSFTEAGIVSDFSHVKLAKNHRMMIVCPATANSIAKMAYGFADNVWLSAFLMFNPHNVYVYPAMNPAMWKNQITRRNVKKLCSAGVKVRPVKFGKTACGDTGYGRLMEKDDIFNEISEIERYKGWNFLINGGATREFLDEVRYLGNGSSGLTAFFIADYIAARGGRVSVVLANADFEFANFDVVSAVNADEMRECCKDLFAECDFFISAAAVSDFRFRSTYKGKLNRNDYVDGLDVALDKVPDILADIAADKRTDQKVMGFSLFENGLSDERISGILRKKCTDKYCDYMIGNEIFNMGADASEMLRYCFFNASTNRVYEFKSNKINLWAHIESYCDFQNNFR